MKKRIALGALAGSLLITHCLFAQEKESELDPVTVTSSITPQKLSQTGRNIIVIKGEELFKLPVNSVDELLRYLPGVEVQARGPMGAQSDIVLRGGTFQQVLVILDGIRLNDPNTGHFNSYIPIAPSEIDRIEILKGASSAIYGSDAVGGVINIITKSFSHKEEQKIREINAQLTGGGDGLLNVDAGGYYTNGKTAVSGGILSNNAHGQPQRGTSGYFHNNTVSLSANHQINPNWQIGARAALDNRDFSAQNFYTTSPADTASESVRTVWSQLQLNYQKTSNKFSFNAGYKAVEDNFRFNTASSPNNNKSKLLQALAVYEHTFGEKTTLVTGSQFQNRNIHSNDRGNHTINEAALFAVLNQTVGTSFHISPAARLDWDERSGTELVPQINLSYHLGLVQLRGSAGKTIRQADFTERYNNYNKTFIPPLNRVGNPDLKAERSFSYEAGADLFIVSGLKIAATYFQRDYKDLIDYVTTPYNDMPRKENLAPAGTYFLAQNLEQLTTRGAEGDFQFNRKLGKDRQLFSSIGLLWLHSVTDNVAPSLSVSTHANFLGNFAISYATSRFSINLSGLYKDRNAQAAAAIKANLSKNYFVMNAKAEGFIIKDRLSVFIEADNLFNENYSDLLGAQMPGRWLMGGFKVSLSK